MALRGEFPIIPHSAGDWLELYLCPDMVAFEWGSGGSTLYLARRVKKLVSVEHSEKWYDVVLGALKSRGLKNCRYLFIPPERLPPEQHMSVKEATIHAGDPESCTSRVKGYINYSFEGYVRSIERYGDGVFDFIFVDGRARASCISSAIPKLRPGRFLMLDNAARRIYQRAIKLMKGWDSISFYGDGPSMASLKWHATIWQKPVEGSDS